MDMEFALRRRRALVVRSHNPTRRTIERVASYIRSINRARETLNMDCWFSVDTTTLSPARRRNHSRAAQHPDPATDKHFCGRKRKRIESRSACRNIAAVMRECGLELGRDYCVHTYTEAQMIAAYPVLTEIHGHCRIRDVKEFTTGACSLAWGMHCEALNLWFQHARGAAARTPARAQGAHGAGTDAYDECWVMEDDVGWAGQDIATELFARYCAVEADLITADADHFDDRWWWHSTHSAAYQRRVPREARRVSREHVQRLSARLLDRLHDFAVAGCTAWSETMTVSVCHAEPDLKLALFEASVLGNPFRYDGRMTPQRWDDIMQGRSKRFRGKLYHALKW